MISTELLLQKMLCVKHLWLCRSSFLLAFQLILPPWNKQRHCNCNHCLHCAAAVDVVVPTLQTSFAAPLLSCRGTNGTGVINNINYDRTACSFARSRVLHFPRRLTASYGILSTDSVFYTQRGNLQGS